jgi:hypothetical protein
VRGSAAACPCLRRSHSGRRSRLVSLRAVVTVSVCQRMPPSRGLARPYNRTARTRATGPMPGWLFACLRGSQRRAEVVVATGWQLVHGLCSPKRTRRAYGWRLHHSP